MKKTLRLLMNNNNVPVPFSNTQNFTAGKKFSPFKFFLGIAFLILPVAILFIWYLKIKEDLSAGDEEKILSVLILAWIIVLFFVRKEYKKTLITSIKKGYFNGSETFLKKKIVTNSLVDKTESNKPLEVIHSLDLLEKSGYSNYENVLLKHLNNPVAEIRDFVISRIIANNITTALPAIKQHLEATWEEDLNPKLVEAFHYLNSEPVTHEYMAAIPLNHTVEYQKAAMKGLLQKQDAGTKHLVFESLIQIAAGSIDQKIMVLEVITDYKGEDCTQVLQTLLKDNEPVIYKKAIETAGKIKNTELFDEVVEVTVSKKAYHSFKRSIFFYGDDVFSKASIRNPALPAELICLIIKSTGNIKGENSTGFLVELLKSRSNYSNEVIDALWLKKSKPAPDAVSVINDWATKKTEQIKHKGTYLQEVNNIGELSLLQQAMLTEIRNDIQVLVKAFAVLYDRKRIDSFVESIYFGKTHKVSEDLQKIAPVIPANYFTDLYSLVQLIDISGTGRTVDTKTDVSRVEAIIKEVLNDNVANFSEWTRSIAIYILPKLNNTEFSLNVLQGDSSKGEQLFNDTRSDVLTLLNK